MTQTDRDTPVTALREALASWDAIEGSGLTDQLRAFIAAGKMADAIRAALASSDDVAGSGESVVRNAWGVRGTGAYDERATLEEAELVLVPRVVAEQLGIAYTAAPTTEAPPKDAPKRQRIDWSNVVVDEGDEAP
jgi:hypothetical protein